MPIAAPETGCREVTHSGFQRPASKSASARRPAFIKAAVLDGLHSGSLYFLQLPASIAALP
jgi:hypothetical protein